MGVAAQNVAEVFPEVVTQDDKGLMSVEYDSLVGPMIEAMRELNAKNAQLESEVAELKSLKAQVAEIKASAQIPVSSDTQARSAVLKN